MATRSTSFCRFCHAFCAITVEVDAGRVTKVIGDVDNPLYGGFTCPKGRALPEQHNHPDRLLRSRKRMADGSHQPVAVETAMEEIAARLRDIVRESGPRAVASYTGTRGVFYPTGKELGKAFMRALGSPMRFTSGTIDQPGKCIARELHGMWSAGPQSFLDADTWMVVGANPTVSMWGGIPHYNPSKHLRDAKARGLKLIVVDPRRTETAANADVFLQPKPGEDPTILAGIIRVIIDEDLYDRSFVDSDVEGFAALRSAVTPFTPEYVEQRAHVPADLVVEAARVFASGRRGSVTAGTGPNMARRGTLTEYLAASLQTICGRWLRAGEPVPNPSIVVAAKDDGWPHRLDVGNDVMMQELAEVASEPVLDHAGYRTDETFAYRLVSRRLRDVYNSAGRDIPHLVRKYSYNPAFMHPDDMADEGLDAGDVVEIDSGHARILGVVEPAPELRRSVISMAHAWGGAPEHDGELRTIGSTTGRLSSTDRDFDPVTGLPIMSAIPVNIRRALDQLEAAAPRST